MRLVTIAHTSTPSHPRVSAPSPTCSTPSPPVAQAFRPLAPPRQPCPNAEHQRAKALGYMRLVTIAHASTPYPPRVSAPSRIRSTPTHPLHQEHLLLGSHGEDRIYVVNTEEISIIRQGRLVERP